MLQLVDGIGRFAAHELDGILVAQPVRPLTVSYMCQYQLSSLMLPSEALTPPCAATVCERVGNTLDRTATDSPAWDSCSEQRMPAPPAPTTTTSNWRRGNEFMTATTA